MKRIWTSFALAACVLAAACSDADGARSALEEQGYGDIQITGAAWTGCSEHDTYATGFVATTLAGFRVQGVVCSSRGLFGGKANTIRTFGRVR